MSDPRMFPIMAFSHRRREEIAELRAAGVGSVVIAIPWAMLEPHEMQADRNHGQTLKRLAERGGLGTCEAVAILENRRGHRMPRPAAMARLNELVRQWQEANL